MKTRKYFVDKITQVIEDGWAYRTIQLDIRVEAETPQKAWKLVKDKLSAGQYFISCHNGTSSRKVFIKE